MATFATKHLSSHKVSTPEGQKSKSISHDQNRVKAHPGMMKKAVRNITMKAPKY